MKNIFKKAFRIVFIYFLVGILWIVLSDKIIEYFVDDVHLLSIIQTFKGWFYVCGTTLLLYWLITKQLKKVIKTSDELENSHQQISEILTKLNQAQATAKIGSWDWEMITNKIWWSDEMYKIFEINPNLYIPEIEANNRFIHPEDTSFYQEVIEGCIAKHIDLNFDIRIITGNRKLKFINVIGRTQYDLYGNPIKMSGTYMDITDRKNAELALRENEEKYRAFFDNSLDAAFLTSPEGKIISANSAAREMLLYSDAELLKLGFNGLVDSSDINSRELFDERDKSGKVRGELTFIRKGGERFPAEISSTVFRNELDQKKTSVIIRDITKRKQAEKEIKRFNEELELLVSERSAELSDLYNNAPCGYHSLDENGIYEKINDTELDWLGYSREEIVGKMYLPDILTDKSKKAFLNVFPVFKKTGVLADKELEMIRKDGTVIIVILNATAIYDSEGNYLRSRSMLFDITDRKLAETSLMKAHSELENVNKELESFSYSVSHDLRTPLRAIDGFSNILLEDYSSIIDDEGKRLLNIIIGNANSMGHLIDNLLAFSRISRHEIKPVKIEMQLLANSVYHELVHEAEKEKIQFILNNIPPSYGDPALVKQVWLNLLSNAIKFSSKKPERRIEVGNIEQGDENIYFIKDNGAGFDMKQSDKLFGVFQRLHKKSEFDGTGVGLAIVQRIVIRLGGRIWAEGKVDEGSVFYFSLPAASKTGR